jgi:serine/threonine protein kinase
MSLNADEQAELLLQSSRPAEAFKISWSELEIDGDVGNGINGVVQRGRWRGLPVAIKSVLFNGSQDELQSEADTLSTLRHPSLALYMGVAREDGDRVALVSEFMRGGTLHALVRDSSIRLKFRQRMEIALSIAQALNYLHGFSPPLLHRALHSHNVLCDSSGYPDSGDDDKRTSQKATGSANTTFIRVSDYALSAFRNKITPRGVKSFGPASPMLWEAPEVLRKNRYTTASDVYALGVILVELITRRGPYQQFFDENAASSASSTVNSPSAGGGDLLTGKTSAQAGLKGINHIKRILGGERPFLPEDVPADLRALIESCLDVDAEKRPVCGDVVNALIVLSKSEHLMDAPSLNPLEIVAVKSRRNSLGLSKKKDSEKEAKSKGIVKRLSQLTLAGSLTKNEVSSKVSKQQIERAISQFKDDAMLIDAREIKLGKKLGQGSFGDVFLGTFRGKRVAVKNCRLGHSLKILGSQATLTSFIKELRIMNSVRHPSLMAFMGVCLDDERQKVSLLMEYCEKGNLHDLLQDKSEHFDFNISMKVLLETAEGVNYLHLNEPAIIHCDLKSPNILIDIDFNVKVADFGLADFKLMPTDGADVVDGIAAKKAGGGPKRLEGGVSAMTSFWLSPEVMESDSFSDKSDVYAFGMIILEMLTRKLPFGDMTTHQAALAVLSDDYRPDIPAFVPPRMRSLIENCWLKDPKERPLFMDVIEELKNIRSDGLPRLELSLDLEGTHMFEKKTTVFAFKSRDTVIVNKPWGTGEAQKGDYVVIGPDDDVYTCAADIFDRTYALVTDLDVDVDGDGDVDVDGGAGAQKWLRSHEYRKVGKIFAKEMLEDFLLETLEGMEHGHAGDWLAQNPVDGEQWPIDARSFAKMYAKVADEQVDAAFDDMDALEESVSRVGSDSDDDDAGDDEQTAYSGRSSPAANRLQKGKGSKSMRNVRTQHRSRSRRHAPDSMTKREQRDMESALASVGVDDKAKVGNLVSRSGRTQEEIRFDRTLQKLRGQQSIDMTALLGKERASTAVAESRRALPSKPKSHMKAKRGRKSN